MAVLEDIKWSVNQMGWNRAGYNATKKDTVYCRVVTVEGDGMGNYFVVYFTKNGFCKQPKLGEYYGDFYSAVCNCGKCRVDLDKLDISTNRVCKAPKIKFVEMENLMRKGYAVFFNDFANDQG